MKKAIGTVYCLALILITMGSGYKIEYSVALRGVAIISVLAGLGYIYLDPLSKRFGKWIDEETIEVFGWITLLGAVWGIVVLVLEIAGF